MWARRRFDVIVGLAFIIGPPGAAVYDRLEPPESHRFDVSHRSSVCKPLRP